MVLVGKVGFWWARWGLSWKNRDLVGRMGFWWVEWSFGGLSGVLVGFWWFKWVLVV